MTDDITIFDRRAVRHHRERAAASPQARFLRQEIQRRLLDCLDDIKRPFDRVLDLGCGDGGLAEIIQLSGRAGWVASLDPAPRFARGLPRSVVGEEEALPFADGSFDLVVSTLGLHWTNDLPGALLQIRRVLRPDGLLLASLYGGETLWELRQALTEAEIEISGGAAPRISPVADLADMGGLLQRAGLALPVADSDTLTVTYANAFALMKDLRDMGETNAVSARPRHFSRRDLFLRAASIYADRFADRDGRIPATFQVINLTAWAPAPGQQRPLRPGSAQTRLADALGAVEQNTGDRVPRKGTL